MGAIRRAWRWVADSVRNNVRFILSKPLYIGLLLLAASIGVVVGVPAGNTAYHYTWNDYRFCDDCHIHDYANEAYERSVHFGLTTCHDCHRVPIRHYPSNLVKTILYGAIPFEEFKKPTVPSVICEQCHTEEHADEPLTGPMPEELRQRVVKIDTSPLHLSHLRSKTRDPGAYRGAKPGTEPKPLTEHTGGFHFETVVEETASWDNGVIVCMDCHGEESNRPHGFSANRDNCVACHSEMKLGSKRLDKISCEECHFWGFAAGGDAKASGESPHGEAAQGEAAQGEAAPATEP